MAKTKLNSRVKHAILKAVEVGVPISKAAPAAGVSQRSFNRWRARGENPRGEEDKVFVSLVQDLEEAEAKFIRTNVQIVSRAAEKDPENARWLLERRLPCEFGKRVELEVGPSKVLLALQDKFAELKRIEQDTMGSSQDGNSIEVIVEPAETDSKEAPELTGP